MTPSPAKPWDGVPDRADRDGWHWITPEGEEEPQLFWLEDKEWWYSPEDRDGVWLDLSRGTYHGPVDPPGTLTHLANVIGYAQAHADSTNAAPHCREVVAAARRVVEGKGDAQ